MKRIFIFIFFLAFQVLPLTILSQQSSSGWLKKFETNKVFIENKGQFNLPGSSENVLYAFDNSSAKIYFTKNGIEYRFLKILPKKNKEGKKKFNSVEEWREKEAEEREVKLKSDIVSFTWEGANPDVQVIAQDPTPDYYSYSFKNSKGVVENSNHINGYKKILYKNLYPQVDVEYVFHETDGIKYSLILHPGADLSKIKMNYSEKPKLLVNGDMHIKTRLGDIVEHAPVSFYADNNKSLIKSEFEVNANIVSFNTVNWDNTKSMIIDPWVQTPTLPSSNGVWECESDSLGNVYIIGGDMPMKLIKYNSSGAILWTYSTPWDTAGVWLGTLITDKAGNSYVSSGSLAALQKINSSGSLIWNWVSTSPFYSDEYWDMAFNSDQTKLVIGGTSGTSAPVVNLWGAVFEVDTSNGSVNSITKVGIMRPGTMGMPDEVRSITASNNAMYYYLLHDSLGCIKQDFSVCSNGSNLFKINSTYNLLYKCENYSPNNGNGGGIKAIKTSNHFLYTLNGVIIQKRSLSDGSILLSDSIPGGISNSIMGQNQLGNAGIDIDSCGNVYVGSGDRVIKYDENLNMIIQSVILPFRVYDIKVSNNGNIIVAGTTGNNTNTIRTGYVQSIDMSACNPKDYADCNANICNTGPFCLTDTLISLSSSSTGGVWNGAGITDSIVGTFDPSIAGVGVHTIIYVLSCGTDSTNILVGPCVPLSACQESNGNITVSDGLEVYNWEYYTPASSTPITNQAECEACDGSWTPFINQCTIGGLPSTTCNIAASWITFATGNTVIPPSFPIRVTDLYGSTLIIQNIDSLPECLSSAPISKKNPEGVSIYPNPNKDILYIDLPGNENYLIEIFDIKGRKVFETNGKSNKITINTNGFPKGDYLINIKTEKISNFNSKLVIK